MRAGPLKKHYTLDEYQKFEERSAVRHEYHDGELFAMAGETANHSRICVNISTMLNVFLHESPCLVHDSNMKLHIKTRSFEKILYPDVSVTCHVNDQNNRTFMEQPKVIVEVLSKSTALYDRTDKFQFYKHVHSLENYILVDQYQRLLEVFQKVPDQLNSWLLTTWDSNEFQLPAIQFTGRIADIYHKVHL
ncbi:MAG: Uma2 family endonuclease [SAR324 cluster bacterium]|nr:Uma2 family endonuclease [SAR324 cluster bacterium]